MNTDAVRLQFVLEDKVSDAVTGVATVYGDNEHKVYTDTGIDTYEVTSDEPKDGSIVMRRDRDGKMFKAFVSVTVTEYAG
jgi:hypothetical protein